jgi:hypothetical protein
MPGLIVQDGLPPAKAFVLDGVQQRKTGVDIQARMELQNIHSYEKASHPFCGPVNARQMSTFGNAHKRQYDKGTAGFV